MFPIKKLKVLFHSEIVLHLARVGHYQTFLERGSDIDWDVTLTWTGYNLISKFCQPLIDYADS